MMTIEHAATDSAAMRRAELNNATPCTRRVLLATVITPLCGREDVRRPRPYRYSLFSLPREGLCQHYGAVSSPIANVADTQ
jgi:hypothetical protein